MVQYKAIGLLFGYALKPGPASVIKKSSALRALHNLYRLPSGLVTVVFRFEGAFHGNAEVGGLGGGKRVQLHTDLFQVQAGYFFVQAFLNLVCVTTLQGLVSVPSPAISDILQAFRYKGSLLSKVL